MVRKRIVKKWKKQGVYEERMRTHLARRGRSVEWKPNYFGEDYLRDKYLDLQSIDPQNSLLNYGSIDNSGHFTISERFFADTYKHCPKEDFATLRKTAVRHYMGMLINEYRHINSDACPAPSRAETPRPEPCSSWALSDIGRH